MQYGLIPEFIGRLPVASAVHQLSREDLITILTEPRNAIVKQFQRFFSFDGIELVFTDDALKAVADKALERETGARGLRSIIEEVLLEVQFELPSRRDVKKCVVTKETVERGLKPTLVTEAPDDETPGREVRLATRRRRTPAPSAPIGPSGARYPAGADMGLEDRTRYDPPRAEPRIFARWLESGRTTPSRRGRRTRTTPSRSRRRTSPARCTWGTRSTGRSRTR